MIHTKSFTYRWWGEISFVLHLQADRLGEILLSHTWRLIVLFFLFFFLPGFQQIKAVNGICPKGKVIRSLRTSLFKSDLKLVLPLPIQEEQCSASDVLIGSQATILTSALVLARFCTPLSCQSLYILLAKAPVNCWAEVFENHTQYRAKWGDQSILSRYNLGHNLSSPNKACTKETISYSPK